MRIAGRWRITEAQLRDGDALNLVAPAIIEFTQDGSPGSSGFIAVQGQMDCREAERDGRPGVEFSGEGTDERDPASGSGWAVLEEDGSLRGRIFFHLWRTTQASRRSARRPEAAPEHPSSGGPVVRRASRGPLICVTRSLLAGRLVAEARVARTHLAITAELAHGVHTGWLTSRRSCPGGDPGGHVQPRHLLTAARSASAT
jgi:hypothetical protein